MDKVKLNFPRAPSESENISMEMAFPLDCISVFSPLFPHKTARFLSDFDAPEMWLNV